MPESTECRRHVVHYIFFKKEMGLMTFKKRKEKTDQGLGWKAQAPRLFFLMSEPTLGSFFILPILYLVLKK
jgi:hypothetical protein